MAINVLFIFFLFFLEPIKNRRLSWHLFCFQWKLPLSFFLIMIT